MKNNIRVDDALLPHSGGFGSFSPVCVYAPLLFIFCLCRDIPILFFSVALFCFALVLTRTCNTSRLYRLPRLLTFPARLALFIVVFSYATGDLNLSANGMYLELYASYISLVGMASDFLFGDVTRTFVSRSSVFANLSQLY